MVPGHENVYRNVLKPFIILFVCSKKGLLLPQQNSGKEASPLRVSWTRKTDVIGLAEVNHWYQEAVPFSAALSHVCVLLLYSLGEAIGFSLINPFSWWAPNNLICNASSHKVSHTGRRVLFRQMKSRSRM